VVPTAVASEPRSLMDLFYPGFYMVFLLKNGQMPRRRAFRERVKALLLQVDRGAKRLGLDSADVYQAKFAFCGLLDEILLTSRGHARGLDAQPAAAGTVR
jgi:type VI secretion system protein ImpK